MLHVHGFFIFEPTHNEICEQNVLHTTKIGEKYRLSF